MPNRIGNSIGPSSGVSMKDTGLLDGYLIILSRALDIKGGDVFSYEGDVLLQFICSDSVNVLNRNCFNGHRVTIKSYPKAQY